MQLHKSIRPRFWRRPIFCHSFVVPRFDRRALLQALVLWTGLSFSCFAQFAVAQEDQAQDSILLPAPEQIRLSEILISTPQPYDESQVSASGKKAREIQEAIRRGEKFDDLAKAYSQGPTAQQEGDLGYFRRGKLAPLIENLVFAMRVGDISEVLRTKQGFVILEVTDRIEQGQIPIEVLSGTITPELRPYLEEIMKKVRARWYAIIPYRAKAPMLKQGNVAVQFVVHHDGVIAERNIASSSGDAALDDAASKAVEQSSPFSPFPGGVEAEELDLLFHFQYNPAKIARAR